MRGAALQTTPVPQRRSFQRTRQFIKSTLSPPKEEPFPEAAGRQEYYLKREDRPFPKRPWTRVGQLKNMAVGRFGRIPPARGGSRRGGCLKKGALSFPNEFPRWWAGVSGN